MKPTILASVVLIAATLNLAAADVAPVQVELTCAIANVNQTTIRQLGVNISNGVIKIGPSTTRSLSLPAGSQITGTSPYSKDGVSDVLALATKDDATKLYSCDLAGSTSKCTLLPPVLGLEPSVALGMNGSNAVINVILKVGVSELSEGLLFNPATGKLKGPKFPFFIDPEKTFPPAVIGSVGVSQDGLNSFQLVNFGAGYTFFRHNNSTLHPTGAFVKTQLPESNIYLTSGSLTNRIHDSLGGPDFVLFAYREFHNPGQPNITSQVRMQKLNAETLAPIGAALNLTPLVHSAYADLELSQSVSFEGGGTMIAFTLYNAGCKKDILSMRTINGTGKPGPIKTVIPCAQLADSTSGVSSLSAHQVQ